MVNPAPKPAKPSDFPEFAMKVYQASATYMDYPQFFDLYEDLLRLMFWNPDIDLPLAISQGYVDTVLSA